MSFRFGCLRYGNPVAFVLIEQKEGIDAIRFTVAKGWFVTEDIENVTVHVLGVEPGRAGAMLALNRHFVFTTMFEAIVYLRDYCQTCIDEQIKKERERRNRQGL